MQRAMRGVSVIVIRWNGGKIRSSKPCKQCCEFMRKLNVKNIHYSDDNGSMKREKTRDIKTEHICLARHLGLC